MQIALTFQLLFLAIALILAIINAVRDNDRDPEDWKSIALVVMVFVSGCFSVGMILYFLAYIYPIVNGS